jgi:hypothetical protein
MQPYNPDSIRPDQQAKHNANPHEIGSDTDEFDPIEGLTYDDINQQGLVEPRYIALVNFVAQLAQVNESRPGLGNAAAYRLIDLVKELPDQVTQLIGILESLKELHEEECLPVAIKTLDLLTTTKTHYAYKTLVAAITGMSAPSPQGEAQLRKCSRQNIWGDIAEGVANIPAEFQPIVQAYRKAFTDKTQTGKKQQKARVIRAKKAKYVAQIWTMGKKGASVNSSHYIVKWRIDDGEYIVFKDIETNIIKRLKQTSVRIIELGTNIEVFGPNASANNVVQ